MRTKFKIMYPQDHWDADKRGKPYKPPANHMIVMSNGGVFFQYCGEDYMAGIKKLSDVLPKYDVVWK